MRLNPHNPIQYPLQLLSTTVYHTNLRDYFKPIFPGIVAKVHAVANILTRIGKLPNQIAELIMQYVKKETSSLQEDDTPFPYNVMETDLKCPDMYV